MKKTMGVTVIDGKVVIIEKDSVKVICIKNYNGNPMIHKKGIVLLNGLKFEKGIIYDYVLDQNDDNTLSNPHSVFVGYSYDHFDQEKFDEHFMFIDEYRNKKIQDLGI